MNTIDARSKALECVRSALDKKAYDLVVMEVGGLTSLADYFVICTGRSDTQVQAIALGIETGLQQQGIVPLSVEGYTHGQWVVVDCGDVVVHIFNEPVRAFYDLERLWARAPRLLLPEPYQTRARDLRLAVEAR